MNSESTKLIERYLSNELSASEKLAFEKELAENPSLQQEVEFQKQIHEGIKRASTRSKIKSIGKSYHLYKKLVTSGIVVAAITAASLIGYAIYSSNKSKAEGAESSEVKALIETLKEKSPIDNLASEFFFWKGSDSVVLSKEGVLLSIPENAFLLNGAPYSKNAIVQWQEAIDGATIVKSGLSTMADDRLLETQGMFGIQAYTEKGEKLTVNPKVGIYVQAPVDQYKKDMQLFSGEKGKDGTINWVNPKPLMKIPVPVDMKDLNFYPQGYEAKLDELKKPKEKKYRDSLYLSFDEGKNVESEKSTTRVYGIAEEDPYNYNLTDTIRVEVNQDYVQVYSVKNVSPSKVLSFWQPEFNNTLLATREFEKRMVSIHNRCENRLLNLYTSNLSKSMCEIDEMAVEMGYREFSVFAEEQIGALNPNSPHLKGLQDFYNKTIEKLKKIVKLNSDFKKKKEAEWDNELKKSRENAEKRASVRQEQNLIEENNFNLKNVYKQLGKESPQMINAVRQLSKSVGFTLTNSNIVNIDRYVFEATVSRTSTSITDPETGKTAKITYNPFSFKVKGSEEYGKLFAYLFPSELNSYQRISGEKGAFDYPLNNDINYHLCIVGISENGFFYKELRDVKKGNLGQLSLTQISEKAMDNNIKLLNETRGIIGRMPIGSELSWLVKEQQNYIVQKKRREDVLFRNTIKKVIFPCYGEVVVYGDSEM